MASGNWLVGVTILALWTVGKGRAQNVTTAGAGQTVIAINGSTFDCSTINAIPFGFPTFGPAACACKEDTVPTFNNKTNTYTCLPCPGTLKFNTLPSGPKYDIGRPATLGVCDRTAKTYPICMKKVFNCTTIGAWEIKDDFENQDTPARCVCNSESVAVANKTGEGGYCMPCNNTVFVWVESYYTKPDPVRKIPGDQGYCAFDCHQINAYALDDPHGPNTAARCVCNSGYVPKEADVAGEDGTCVPCTDGLDFIRMEANYTLPDLAKRLPGSSGFCGVTDLKASGLSKPQIIGIAVGTALLFIILVLALIFAWRYHKKAKRLAKEKEVYQEVFVIPDKYKDAVSEACNNPNSEEAKKVRKAIRERGGNVAKECIIKLQKLGEGEFGAVYSGIVREGSKCAMMAIKELKTNNPEELATFTKEVDIMKNLDHENVMVCIGATTTEPLMMLLELMSGGDLSKYLRTRKDSPSNHIDIPEKVFMTFQMARGMAYLSGKGIVHRDLAARNCMLGNPSEETMGYPILKISDFGMSRSLETEQQYYHMDTAGKVPAAWMPPECLRDRKFSPASDVWSFAVTVWEIFSDGAAPFKNVNVMTLLEVLEAGCRLGQPHGCPENTYMMMQKCWDKVPTNRPDFDELVSLSADIYVQCAEEPVAKRMKANGEIYLEMGEVTKAKALARIKRLKSQASGCGNGYQEILHEKPPNDVTKSFEGTEPAASSFINMDDLEGHHPLGPLDVASSLDVTVAVPTLSKKPTSC